MRLLFLVLLIANLSLSIINPRAQFQRTVGSSGGDYSPSILQTTDAGYIMAGYTNSFGAGNNDFYIVKISAAGSLQWSKTVGGAGNDIALTIIQTTDGGYAVSGETTSFGAGNFDAYIVKLDFNGVLQWTRTYGGGGDEYGESIIRTTDGGYAVVGYTNSFGAGDYDMNILKLDAAGTLQWSKTVGTAGYDYALTMVQTTDGGYALFGSTGAFGAGYNDFYIAKLDAAGSLQWSRTVGGDGGDFGFSIIQTSDGGYALSGTTMSFGAIDLNLYFVKLDAGGSLVWTRTIGGTGHDYGYTIIQSSDGGYAVSASTSSFGAGGYDAYMVKLNSSGVLEWSRTAGGVNDDRTLSIIQTPDGGFAAAGSTESFGAGDADIFIVKLDSSGITCGNTSSPSPVTGTGGGLIGNPPSVTTSPAPSVSSPSPFIGSGGVLSTLCFLGVQPISNELPASYELFQNYPNPFNPVIRIRFQIPLSRGVDAEGGRGVLLNIYDILGREVTTLVNEHLKPGSYGVEWDASNYPSGVYFYQLTISNEQSVILFSQTKKMVLLK